MNMQRILIAIVGTALLSACATQAPRAPLPPGQRDAALVRQQTRESRLARAPDWELQGRVALSNGQRGGSGRIDWRQEGGTFAVALSAPITRQSWRISGDSNSARLEGLDGGPRTGSDASVLLREATGWDIPVTALSSWARGGRAPQSGPAQLQFDADGRLTRLQQAGWTLDYADWRQDPALGIELPHRVNAQRDPGRVRLVVDAWTQDASGP